MLDEMQIIESCTYAVRHRCIIGTRPTHLSLGSGGVSYRCAEGFVLTVRTTIRSGRLHVVTFDIEGKPHHSTLSSAFLRSNFHCAASQEMLLT